MDSTISSIASSEAAKATDTQHQRRIKSFVRRAGRVTAGQKAAFERLSDQMLLSLTEIAEPAGLDAAAQRRIFGRAAPLVFEIGFGMGDASAAIAAHFPEHNFLACDVHQAGIGAYMRRLDAQGSQNVRIINHDAVEVLEKGIPKNTLFGVHVYFPDPWPKLRHKKRRLLQAHNIRLIAERIASGGYLHIATDWQDYAVDIRAACENEALLVPRKEPLTPNADGWLERPVWRAQTRFESRGLRLGHRVYEIILDKK